MNQKLQEYINQHLESQTFVKFNKFQYGKENASCTSFMNEEEIAQRIDRTYLDDAFDTEDLSEIQPVFSRKAKKIDTYIQESKTESHFQELLFQYIDARELKDSDVYNQVHIDRRLFSKIRSDCQYHPSKETVILLGLSLQLNEEEIEKLLNSASYSLPKNNVYDLIIRFCFVEGIYEIKEVNELLDSYHCKLFAY